MKENEEFYNLFYMSKYKGGFDSICRFNVTMDIYESPDKMSIFTFVPRLKRVAEDRR